MAYIVPELAETAADQRRYTEARMVPVSCAECSATVRVKKNSEQHTSVQWTAAAVAACAEFSRLEESPSGRSLHAPCPRLNARIAAAVREGLLTIGAEDGY